VKSLPALIVPGLVRNRSCNIAIDMQDQSAISVPLQKPVSQWPNLGHLRGSFGSFGALERVSSASIHRRLRSDALRDLDGALRVVEPPTPQRRCATDDDVATAYGFDFDALDAMDEEDEVDPGVTAPANSVCLPFKLQDEDSGSQAVVPQEPGAMEDIFDFEALEAACCAQREPGCSPSAEAGLQGSAVRSRKPRPSSAPAAERSEGLRVAILANGSRGDVQPFVALALRLSRMRHRVRIMTNADLVDFCVGHGVDAVPVFVSWSIVIEQIGGMSGSSADVKCARCMRRGKAAAEEWLKMNPLACRAAEDCLEEFQPQAVICGLQSTGPALRLELGTGVPSIYTFFARDQLEIGVAFTQAEPARPSFFASSPVYEPVDTTDFSKDLHQTGAWILADEPTSADIAEGGRLHRLKAFLASGPRPLAMGWGSMIAEGLPPVAMLSLALRTLRDSGRRGVILGGWAKLHTLGEQLIADGYLPGLCRGTDFRESFEECAALAEYAESNVCFIEEAPHGWLLPQCSCFVHHGGAGTTHAALAAGIPSVITPIFGDQFANAETLEALDAGAAFELPLQELSSSQLAQAVQVAEASAMQADACGRRLRAEDGVRIAAAVIDRFLRAEVQSGRWADQLRHAKIAEEANHRRSSAGNRSGPGVTAAGPPVSPLRCAAGSPLRERTPPPMLTRVRISGRRAVVRGAM